MMRITFSILSSLIVGFLVLAAAPVEKPKVSQSAPVVLQGFQEWKKDQIFDAQMSLDKFKSPQLASDTPENAKSSGAGQPLIAENAPEGERTDAKDSETSTVSPTETNNEEGTPKPLSQTDSAPTAESAERLRQLEFNLEIAKGLTIHDYFALYLKNKSKAQVASVIEKLSPDELSELLVAYRKSLYGAPEAPPAPAPAQN